MYESITGKYPFNDNNVDTLKRDITNEKPITINEYSGDITIKELVEKMIIKVRFYQFF